MLETRRAPLNSHELLEYMTSCRELVLEELQAIVRGRKQFGPVLYDLMMEYPLREAKGLRPAVCVAVCRAFGGQLEGVLKSAAVLELYHNAFLIHDDVEDGSEQRRDLPTLHRRHGIPAAINVGDAMLALALQPLLDNVRDLGLGRALRIMDAVSVMARESAEGQAVELSWIRSERWALTDRDYLRMVHKKTGWYTFITPSIIGGTIAGCDEDQLRQLRRFSTALGLAFQIQDDILNLTADEHRYGKEQYGDLWEGKHTLLLMHAVRSAAATDRRRALDILTRRRPVNQDERSQRFAQLVEELRSSGELPTGLQRRFDDVLSVGVDWRFKTAEDIAFLLDLIRKHGSIEHASRVARRRALRARLSLERLRRWLPSSEHFSFLEGLVDFVVERDH